MTQERSNERIEKDVKIILKSNFWLSDIKTNTFYERLHDDHDGTMEGALKVVFNDHGDSYVQAGSPRVNSSLRFRNISGGTQSPRVYNALKILALAIKLDNEEHEDK